MHTTVKKVYLIDSLYRIGMADPFPNNPNLIITCNDDLPAEEKMVTEVGQNVYGETRYIKGFSPYCIYIPTKDVMFKLMRACVGVKHVEDLWFNRQENID